MTALFVLLLAVSLGSGVATYALVAGALHVARDALGRCEPAARARVLSLLALAPAIAAVIAPTLCALPSIEAAVGLATDHCHAHGDHHLHLCFLHPPTSLSTGFTLLVAVLGAVTLVRVAGLLRTLWHARAEADALVREAQQFDDVLLVQSDVAFSAAVGLLTPVILVTRGLRSLLSAEESRAVLAHERAHAARRDALRLVVARITWSPLPAACSALLLSELSLACEETCDRAAAEAVDDPLVVAHALLCAARAGSTPVPLLSMGLVTGAIDRRVSALLDPPSRPIAHTNALLAISLIALVLAAPLVHHVAETLLAPLSR